MDGEKEKEKIRRDVGDDSFYQSKVKETRSENHGGDSYSGFLRPSGASGWSCDIGRWMGYAWRGVFRTLFRRGDVET